MKQWFSRHWTWGDEEQWSPRDRKQIRWALNCPRMLLEKVLESARLWGELRNPSKTPWSPWVEEWSWLSEEAKAAQVHWAKDQEGESRTDRTWKLCWGPPANLQVMMDHCTQVRKPPEARETPERTGGSEPHNAHRTGKSAPSYHIQGETPQLTTVSRMNRRGLPQ